MPSFFYTLTYTFPYLENLYQVPGSKDLVIDHTLISALDLVCGIGLLRTAGVDKIFKLEPGNSTPGNARCCFFVRSENTSQIRLASDLILADTAAGRTREYVLIVTPRLTTSCEILLEETGVYGNVTIIEVNRH